MSSAFAIEEPTLPPNTWSAQRRSGAPVAPVCGSTRSDAEELVFVTTVLRHPTGRRIALPMSVEVHHGPGYAAVVEPRTGIHGAGATDAEAIADFWRAIHDFDAAISDASAPNLRALRLVLDRLLAA